MKRLSAKAVRPRDHELRLSHSRVRRSLDFGARARSRWARRGGRGECRQVRSGGQQDRVVAAQRPPRARAFRDRLCRRMLGDPASRSCRSPRTSCSPPFCLAIAITSRSSIMKLRADQPGRLEPLPFKRSSTRVQCGSRLLAPSFPPRPLSTVCGASSIATRKGGFIDLRAPGLGTLQLKLRMRRKQSAPVLGYVADGEILVSR